MVSSVFFVSCFMRTKKCFKRKLEANMKVNIGDKVKIEATVVGYNEGAKIVKLRIEGLQEDNCTPAERYIRMQYADCEKMPN